MPYNTIIVDIDAHVATLTFNRPEKLNALNPEICQETSSAIKTLDENEDVKALIMTGAGRAFCSGADLTGANSASASTQPNITRTVRTGPFALMGHVINQLSLFSKPVIAAVNGPAVGAGMSYALAADIRIASEGATFSCIFVKRGLVPDMGLSFYLPRLVGISRAVEMMMTGDMIDAAQAERIGLVNRVVTKEQLMPAAMELAQRLANGPSLAIEMSKRMAYAGLNADSPLIQMEMEYQMYRVAAESEDFKEGVAAFREKREPRFTGK
jgi:2-(1,2-epoxy-1,2-dihydrophenyl)acetyl-CoA isomerase